MQSIKEICIGRYVIPANNNKFIFKATEINYSNNYFLKPRTINEIN